MKRTTKICLKRNGILAAVVGIFLFAHYVWGITCPLLWLLGYPCPTCGVTRAMLCLLQGDFIGYWRYHPLAVFLCVAVVLMLNGAGQKWIRAYAIIVATATFLLWIIRW